MRVIMTGRNMVGDGGVAEVAEVCRYQGKYSLVSHDDMGTFDTDNAAIEAFGLFLSKKNKGKWSASRDAMSLSGGEYPVERCPECEGQLIRKSFLQPADGWNSVPPNDLWCGKCLKFVSVPGWRSRATSGLSDIFESKQ